MSDASTLWAISIKGDQSSAALKTAVAEFANVTPFKIPANQLRVGTLDSLMSLSDDLVKMDTLAEATVTKMYKQLQELKPEDDGPTIFGGERPRLIFAFAGSACVPLQRCLLRSTASVLLSGIGPGHGALCRLGSVQRPRLSRRGERSACLAAHTQIISLPRTILTALPSLTRGLAQCLPSRIRRCNGSGTRPNFR